MSQGFNKSPFSGLITQEKVLLWVLERVRLVSVILQPRPGLNLHPLAFLKRPLISFSPSNEAPEGKSRMPGSPEDARAAGGSLIISGVTGLALTQLSLNNKDFSKNKMKQWARRRSDPSGKMVPSVITVRGILYFLEGNL